MDVGTVMQNLSSVIYKENSATLEYDQPEEKLFVGRKPSIKFIKIFRFVLGMVTALLLSTIIIICTSSHVYTMDGHTATSQSAPNREQDYTDLLGQLPGHVIVDVGNHKFWIMNSETQNSSIIEVNTIGSINTFDYDYRNKTMIWIEHNSTEFKSHVQISRLIEAAFARKVKASSFRIDHITGNIYMIDSIAGTVNVINIESGHFGIVSSEIMNPHDLVLDSSKGVMFIASKHHSLSRANMNGENLKLIVKNTHVSALAIDCVLKNVYFAVDFSSVERINYIGSSRVTITKVVTAISSLSILNGNLYWTGESILWRCEIEETTYGPRCKNDSPSHVAAVRNAKTVRSYAHVTVEANPCIVSQCQHLCLLATVGSSARYSCACAVGWELEADGKSCKLVVDYLLYALGNHVRARSLDLKRRSFNDVIIPTEFFTESLKQNYAIDFDYDMRHDRLFLSDDYNIYAMSIKGGNLPEQKRLVHVDDTFIIGNVAYDWQSGYLYYVRRSTSDSHDHRIMVLRYDDKLLLELTVQILSYEDGNCLENCPYSIIVVPDAGFLLYTAFKNEWDAIKRLSIMQGVVNELRFLPYYNTYRSLAIDYEESTLYFLSNRSETTISSMNYDASSETMRFRTHITNVTSMFVYRQWLYISNETSIWRVDKKDATGTVQMIESLDSRILSGIRIISPNIQTIDAASPCAFNNGGCKQFCLSSFAVKTCRCTETTQNIFYHC